MPDCVLICRSFRRSIAVSMMQSFFAWHVEDADLYSVNFLHWGAPKIWYCVPPSSKAKFERLAAAMHPEAFRACKGFLRHKDILISPSILKQYDVSYQMVRSVLVELCRPIRGAIEIRTSLAPGLDASGEASPIAAMARDRVVADVPCIAHVTWTWKHSSFVELPRTSVHSWPPV